MYLLYCDETNLEERAGDFFVYAGISISGEKAQSLSSAIDDLRKKFKVPRDFALKFNPAPTGVSHADFNALKQALIEAAIAHEVKLHTSIVLHDIARDPDAARRNAINTICFHFDCALIRYKVPGLVLIDRFNDKQIDRHLVEKFSIGVTGLPHTSEMRLSNVVGFHYAAIGQSNFSTLIDVILGSLRFSVNAFTRNDADRLKTAALLIKLFSPLFFRETGQTKVPEIGFYMSPKAIKVDSYRAKYVALKEFFGSHGLDIQQTPSSQ